MGSQNNYLYRKLLLGSIPREQSDNNSILTVKYNPNKPNMTLMPSKFQSSDGAASFSQGRNIFLNIENTNIPTNNFALKQAFLNDKSNKKMVGYKIFIWIANSFYDLVRNKFSINL